MRWRHHRRDGTLFLRACFQCALWLVCIVMPLFFLGAQPRKGGKPTSRKESTHLKTSDPRHISKTRQESSVRPKPKPSAPKKQSSDKEFVLKIEVSLGDSRSLAGELPLRAPEKFQVEHIKDGIRYQKEIRLSDIDAIEIRRWSGKLLAQKKDGTLYEFVPDRIFVRLKDGYTMIAIGNVFSFIRQFPVYNSNGRVYVFSYWRDLQKKDGTWFTGLRGPILGRRVPHKDVVHRIQFVSIKKAGK